MAAAVTLAGVGASTAAGAIPAERAGTLTHRAQSAAALVGCSDPKTLSSAPHQLTDVAHTLFFTADDGIHGRELWKSDGSGAGTVLVKDIHPGGDYQDGFGPSDLAAFRGKLFFDANDGIHGRELWKSDGTRSGTVLVKNIDPGAGSSYPVGMTGVAGTLFFMADDGTHGSELWKADGTRAGTVLVRDIDPGAGNSNPRHLTAVARTLFFTSNDGTHGPELWKSDGTRAGTVLVKDIYPGGDWGDYYPPAFLTDVGGTLFFAADDGVHGWELWKSDGTQAGTVMVKDISPGYGGYPPFELTNLGGTLFFTADDGTHGYELWKSDGTEAGTVMVKDIHPGGDYDYGYGPSALTAVRNTLFFAADDGTHGEELWKSDGTRAGTVLVKNIRPSDYSSYPEGLTADNGELFFVAEDGTHGPELWKSDGTRAGTVMVKDIHPCALHEGPRYLTNVGGILFFSADDGTHGQEPWTSDGSRAGTVLVKDVNSQPVGAISRSKAEAGPTTSTGP